MVTNKSKIAIFALIICSMFTLSGCGKKEIPPEYAKYMADQTGKYLKLGFYGAPAEIDPIKAAETEHDKMFCNLVFASPLRKTEEGKYKPYLFESFETKLEDEKLVVIGNWRKGLKWHDGKDFNVSEFEYSINQMKLPEKNSPYSDTAKEIISIKNDGDTTEITFKENSKKYLDMLCAGIIPEHILSKENIASGTTLEESYKNYIKKPIGLGPYQVKENKDNKFMLLEPNQNFFDGKGSTRPNVVIICSYELQQTISDFREKQLDWMSAPSMIAEQLKNLGIENIHYVEYPNPAVLTWVFNTQNDKLRDVNIRKALNLIMDRNIIKQSFGEGATLLFDNLIPVEENITPEKTASNLEEGKRLLEQAGIVDKNNDGFRDFNGNTFKLSILINNDSVSRRIIAEKMIESLKAIGIQAEIKAVGWNEFVSNELKGGKFETALLSYHISNDCSMKYLFGSKNIVGNDSLNFTGIDDAELDANLIILDSAVTDRDKNLAYKIVNEKLSALCPCAFLIRPCDLALIHGTPVKTIKSKSTIWDDILSWKIMFGKEN